MHISLPGGKALSLGNVLGLIVTGAGYITSPLVLAMLPAKYSVVVAAVGTAILSLSKQLVHTPA
jgi:hypothetical protein